MAGWTSIYGLQWLLRSRWITSNWVEMIAGTWSLTIWGAGNVALGHWISLESDGPSCEVEQQKKQNCTKNPGFGDLKQVQDIYIYISIYIDIYIYKYIMYVYIYIYLWTQYSILTSELSWQMLNISRASRGWVHGVPPVPTVWDAGEKKGCRAALAAANSTLSKCCGFPHVTRICCERTRRTDCGCAASKV